MADLERTLAGLEQMRWREAHRASGGAKDEATDKLIRAHHAVVALKAAIANGPPEVVLHVDVDGYPLDPEHSWNQPKAQR